MDERTRQQARQHRGVVGARVLGHPPARAAAAERLEVVQPRTYLASTQPVTGPVLVEAVRQSVRTRYAFLSAAALWLLGAGPAPGRDDVLVAVPHSSRLRLEPPVRVTRVSPHVLAFVRTRSGCSVVDLEMAVLSACAQLPGPSAAQLLEPLLRERRTTVVRLRARCRRGVSGSAVVRRACDELVGGSLDAAVRRLRRGLEARGVAGLACEVRFTSADGASCYGDLWCEPARTLVEVDGFLTHAVRERFRADRRRDRWMIRDHGVTTLRVDVAELHSGLEAVADELAELLLARQPPATQSTQGDQGAWSPLSAAPDRTLITGRTRGAVDPG
jgi:hypothetical protein